MCHRTTKLVQLLTTVVVCNFSCRPSLQQDEVTFAMKDNIIHTDTLNVSTSDELEQLTPTVHVVMHPELASLGIEMGRKKIKGSNEQGRNIVSVYMVFHADLQETTISANLISKDNTQQAFTSVIVEAKNNEARYVDFVFDPSVEIKMEDLIRLEQTLPD